MSSVTYKLLTVKQVHQHLAEALAVAGQADPASYKSAVLASLTSNFGTIVEKIKELIASGLADAPAIEAALKAAGITVPPWVDLVIQILLILYKPTSAAA